NRAASAWAMLADPRTSNCRSWCSTWGGLIQRIHHRAGRIMQFCTFGLVVEFDFVKAQRAQHSLSREHGAVDGPDLSCLGLPGEFLPDGLDACGSERVELVRKSDQPTDGLAEILH